jgi:hypothetical protein
MTILDKRVEKLDALNQNISRAQTISVWLCLVHEHHVLREALKVEGARMNRLALGWTYMPPAGKT